MREVFSKLYVGPETDFEKAKERGYAIISATKEGERGHRALLGYTSLGAPQSSPEYLVARRPGRLILNLIDGDDPSLVPDKVIDAALDFITENLDRGKPVLVHCQQGRSRSPSIVLLWLCLHGKLPANYHEAVKRFRRLYADYDPSDGIRLYCKDRIQKHRR